MHLRNISIGCALMSSFSSNIRTKLFELFIVLVKKMEGIFNDFKCWCFLAQIGCFQSFASIELGL